MLNDAYLDREQSKVKHDILRRYLESFTHIVGSQWPSVTYIDGFSGPWNARTDDLSDTSFAIAIKELQKARETHREKGRDLRIRCVFVERDSAAFTRLEQYCQAIPDIDVHLIAGEFEQAIPEIITFVHQDRQTFPFTLIDPTGYSGFALKRISPLLRLKPGEVLINFMLEFIRRSIEHDGLRTCYEELFGTGDYDWALENLEGIDRDDAITEKYCACLSEICGYDHVLRATVLHPDKDRLNFQLIYGTRHVKGVEVFKKIEERAMKSQEQVRAGVEQRRKSKGGQQSFLDPSEMPESRFYIALRERYRLQAKKAVAEAINSGRHVAYDQLWLLALRFPMVWESDLRGWLRDWRDNGAISWQGLAPRGRELIRGKRHVVALIRGNLE